MQIGLVVISIFAVEVIMIELPPDFPHLAPENYSYEVRSFKRNMVAIWLCHHYNYTYSSDPVSTIWGFYNSKAKEYYAPINSKTVGKQVSLQNTTAYSSMPKKSNPLLAAML